MSTVLSSLAIILVGLIVILRKKLPYYGVLILLMGITAFVYHSLLTTWSLILVSGASVAIGLYLLSFFIKNKKKRESKFLVLSLISGLVALGFLVLDLHAVWHVLVALSFYLLTLYLVQ